MAVYMAYTVGQVAIHTAMPNPKEGESNHWNHLGLHDETIPFIAYSTYCT